MRNRRRRQPTQSARPAAADCRSLSLQRADLCAALLTMISGRPIIALHRWGVGDLVGILGEKRSPTGWQFMAADSSCRCFEPSDMAEEQCVRRTLRSSLLSLFPFDRLHRNSPDTQRRIARFVRWIFVAGDKASYGGGGCRVLWHLGNGPLSERRYNPSAFE